MSRFVALHVSYHLQPPSLLVSLCFFIFFVKWKWPFLSSTATSNYLKKAVLLLFFLCPSFLGQKQLLLCWYSYCFANFKLCGMISFPPPIQFSFERVLRSLLQTCCVTSRVGALLQPRWGWKSKDSVWHTNAQTVGEWLQFKWNQLFQATFWRHKMSCRRDFICFAAFGRLKFLRPSPLQ